MNLSTGNTEDGLIFTVNFEKYGDGKVTVKSVEAIPTWVNLSDGNYRVIPLDMSVDDWKTAFNLNDYSFAESKESYSRTMSLVESGINEFNGAAVSDKEAA